MNTVLVLTTIVEMLHKTNTTVFISPVGRCTFYQNSTFGLLTDQERRDRERNFGPPSFPFSHPSFSA